MTVEDPGTLETLEYETIDYEPTKAPPIKVPMGEHEFVARCPNDYEFAQIHRQVLAIQDENPYDLDVKELISPFFSVGDARDIDLKSRGAEPEIPLDILFSALFALLDHYEPYIEQRSKQANRATRRAKKAPARRQGGRPA